MLVELIGYCAQRGVGALRLKGDPAAAVRWRGCWRVIVVVVVIIIGFQEVTGDAFAALLVVEKDTRCVCAMVHIIAAAEDTAHVAVGVFIEIIRTCSVASRVCFSSQGLKTDSNIFLWK